MRKIIGLLFLIILAFSSQAQKFTISGYIKDAETGESLIGATLLHLKTSSGSSANTHGFYSLTLPKDSISLIYSYVGYQPTTMQFFLKRDTVIIINLQSSTVLNEVVVRGTKADPIHESTKMSTLSVPIEQIKALPAFMGETDILKVLQLMPGVQSGNEGSTGLYVRGGGPDQNLMLLDGVPIYNASHLFGFFSVFNADAINHVELIKGGFPARYGGRLSSVIDINMKEGNMKKVKGEGSIGSISAKVTVEGPINKDKTSFIVSARRTYIDVLAQPIIRAQAKREGSQTTAGYYFYDLNLKLNHILNPRNRLYFSTYLGNDKAYAKSKYTDTYDTISTKTDDQFSLRWGNVITAARWNHVFGPKLFSNVTTTYSRYLFDISQKFQETQNTPSISEEYFSGILYHSGIRDWAAKVDFDYLPSPNHFIRFGANNIWHRFSPGVLAFRSSDEGDTTLGANPTSAYEAAVYAEDDWKISQRLKLNAGVHASAFAVENEWYYSIQPRISSRFLLSDDFSFKASYSSMTQFIHLLTNVGIGLPTDLWVPSTARIRPQQAKQVAIGFAKTYKSQFEFSLEGYYKKMYNLIEYKDGASYLNIEGDWQDKVATNGEGESLGMEVLIQKKTGAVTGWLGYTLSKAVRQFDELNFGKEYAYKYDRRHDISLAMTHEWNKRMDFSMAWVYGTGNAITLPIATYESASSNYNSPFSYGNSEATYYGDRNSFRMRSYHRLDLSFSWWKDKKWGQRKWALAVYNAYNRLNPFFINLEYRHDNPFSPGSKKFVQYSLFPVIPSITYSFKF
ncbi:MAG: TonB-dependent receptor [Bacteroidia bacterium]|nr:TonB-dependent receptor [Bacteroidia bacterium]